MIKFFFFFAQHSRRYLRALGFLRKHLYKFRIVLFLDLDFSRAEHAQISPGAITGRQMEIIGVHHRVGRNDDHGIGR